MFNVNNCMSWTDVQLDIQVHRDHGHAANLRLGRLYYWFDFPQAANSRFGRRADESGLTRAHDNLGDIHSRRGEAWAPR